MKERTSATVPDDQERDDSLRPCEHREVSLANPHDLAHAARRPGNGARTALDFAKSAKRDEFRTWRAAGRPLEHAPFADERQRSTRLERGRGAGKAVAPLLGGDLDGREVDLVCLQPRLLVDDRRRLEAAVVSRDAFRGRPAKAGELKTIMATPLVGDEDNSVDPQRAQASGEPGAMRDSRWLADRWNRVQMLLEPLDRVRRWLIRPP